MVPAVTTTVTARASMARAAVVIAARAAVVIAARLAAVIAVVSPVVAEAGARPAVTDPCRNR